MKNLAVLGISIFLISSANAGMYRWVDEAGEVHFSDKVPVAVSKKTHSVIDKQGQTQKVIDPEAVQKQAEAKKALLVKAEEKKQIALEELLNSAESRKRDKQLLLTYDDKDELSQYFENKIKLAKGNSDIFIAHNARLAKKVKKLEAQKLRVKSKENKNAVALKIIDLNQTIKQYEVALIENNLEIIKLSENYESDFQRFVELTK